MKSSSINSGYQSKIENDYKALELFSSQLCETKKDMNVQLILMQSRIEELNQKGFQDGNFEILHKCFMQNIDNIKQVSEDIEQFSEHINELSKLIKGYYNIEI